jgi:hypothetical protein
MSASRDDVLLTTAMGRSQLGGGGGSELDADAKF